MSLTEADHVFAGLHENAANDILTAFFTTRPRYLTYGSPLFVPATSLTATQMPRIAFPGVPGGGIEWGVELEIPVLDFHPDSSGGMPPQLVLDPDMFSVRTKVTLRLGCMRRNFDDPTDGKQPYTTVPIETSVQVWATGRPSTKKASQGASSVGLELAAVELVDIQPDSMESFLECLIRMILQAVLDQVRIPLHAISAGAVKPVLTRDPEFADDQIKVYGGV